MPSQIDDPGCLAFGHGLRRGDQDHALECDQDNLLRSGAAAGDCFSDWLDGFESCLDLDQEPSAGGHGVEDIVKDGHPFTPQSTAVALSEIQRLEFCVCSPTDPPIGAGHVTGRGVVDDNGQTKDPLRNAVDGDAVPVPHFGVILTMGDWKALRDRLIADVTEFVIEPRIRFLGKPGEQATMFFTDPSGNALEFKAFDDDKQIFEK